MWIRFNASGRSRNNPPRRSGQIVGRNSADRRAERCQIFLHLTVRIGDAPQRSNLWSPVGCLGAPRRSISHASRGSGSNWALFLWIHRRVNSGKRSGRHHTGNNLSAVAAIDAEVGIGGEHEGIGKRFGHPHKAGVGEARGHIGVFLQQLQHGFHVIV
jgi:hypothetical protein